MNDKAHQRVTQYLAELRKHTFNLAFALYLIKCLLGTVICFGVYQLLPDDHLSGAIIACLLVLAPDHKDSMKLSFTRIRANITGGLFGVICFFLPISTLACLCISVPLIIFSCYVQDFGTSTRSALSSFIIVVLQERGTGGTWHMAIERMFAVFIGCAVALILTIIFHFFVQYFEKKYGEMKGKNVAIDTDRATAMQALP